jgi:hypothetical protein
MATGMLLTCSHGTTAAQRDYVFEQIDAFLTAR